MYEQLAPSSLTPDKELFSNKRENYKQDMAEGAIPRREKGVEKSGSWKLSKTGLLAIHKGLLGRKYNQQRGVGMLWTLLIQLNVNPVREKGLLYMLSQ